MAKTITQLPDATVVNAADELIIQQSGVTKRATKTEVLNGIVNANVAAAAAIDGSKITPTFTSDNVVIKNFSDSENKFCILHRARGTEDSPAAVQASDVAGALLFQGYAGSNYRSVGSVVGITSDIASDTNISGFLSLRTNNQSTNPTERVRINADGNVGVGTASPSSKLHVDGDLTVSNSTVATTATAGTNGDVPAQVAGYLVVSINGTSRKIPYYAT
jgi:hypothetical protein